MKKDDAALPTSAKEGTHIVFDLLSLYKEEKNIPHDRCLVQDQIDEICEKTKNEIIKIEGSYFRPIKK